MKKEDANTQPILNRIAAEINIPPQKAASAATLLDEGNTVPFIARYRKEMTGGLTDEDLRLLAEKLTLYRNLEKRREDVLRLLEAQEVLSPGVEAAVRKAATVTELDDIYRPFRPKKRTRALMAREKGLQGLAEFLLHGKGSPDGEAEKYVSEEKGVESREEALAGARDIIAEHVSEEPQVRREMRPWLHKNGLLVSSALKETGSPYEMYYDYREPVHKTQAHRVLALNRGEREGFLHVKIEVDAERALKLLEGRYINYGFSQECSLMLKEAVRDSWKRLLFPSLEREVRAQLSERAEEQAIKVFRENLRGLLLTPPVEGKRILGLDPGYRTGCKLACVDETGKLLETAVIFPTPPRSEKEKARAVVASLLEKHRLNAIAIGNGTAGRESEEFVAEAIRELDGEVEYTVVNEAGASVYSASKIGQSEFPGLDVAERSAVSIARRVQDPLAELVKIEPRSIGVGQYQHDVNQKKLQEILEGVVEACVNQVGVDLNTASAALLERVAGINKPVAAGIVSYREEKGAFRERAELKKVPKLGPAAFTQCAGFLRIPKASNYLDRSAVHPESYAAATQLMSLMGISASELGRPDAIPAVDVAAAAARLQVGEPTLRDIIEEFKKPGRDPREALDRPVFKKGVLHLEDLKAGMELMGVVRNVVDFGAFVDIGVHQDGLVHISQLADKYVRHPLEAVKLGDVVRVRVLEVDVQRKRISLTIKGASPEKPAEH